MARYEVRVIERPQGWSEASLEDVPPRPGRATRVLCGAEELFAAVRAAVQFNETARRDAAAEWAVVVEPGSSGRIWPDARLCTPLGYRVAAMGWPTGWEPQSPWDVPRCLSRAQGETDPAPLSYDRAMAVVRGLNQQSIDQAGSSWYVVVAVENEPISQSVSYDPSGMETTVQVRRLHVAVPDQGSRGNCSYCPAHSLPCATRDLHEPEATTSVTSTRSVLECDDVSSL